jgi:hypothetical protein
MGDLDKHVWQAAADLIKARIAQYRITASPMNPGITEQDEAMAGWIIAELYKFGFIKKPSEETYEPHPTDWGR